MRKERLPREPSRGKHPPIACGNRTFLKIPLMVLAAGKTVQFLASTPAERRMKEKTIEIIYIERPAGIPSALVVRSCFG